MKKPNRVTVHFTEAGYMDIMQRSEAVGDSIPDYIRRTLVMHRTIMQHADADGVLTVMKNDDAGNQRTINIQVI